MERKKSAKYYREIFRHTEREISAKNRACKYIYKLYHLVGKIEKITAKNSFPSLPSPLPRGKKVGKKRDKTEKTNYKLNNYK